jgi:phytanoyl-CoA hydroxylase
MIDIGSDLIQEYNENGFVKIKNVFSPSEVNNIIQEFGFFMANDAKQLSGRDINYVDVEKKIVNSVHKLHVSQDGFFTNLLNSERMKNIASKFLNDEAVPRASEMFAKPPEKGLPSPIHQDNFYWCLTPPNALTIWVALDSCNKENGVVSYMKGSHKLGILPHVDSFAPGSSQMVERKSIPSNLLAVSENLNAGDVLIHHSLTIHWSAANISGNSRRAMTLQYQGKNASTDPAMLKHYESQLLSQVKIRESSQEKS